MNHFFESFQNTAYEKGNWELRNLLDGRIAAWLPGEIKETEESDGNASTGLQQYNSFYESSAFIYLCTCKNLVANFWVKDDTTLLNQEVEKNTGENDSLARKEFLGNPITPVLTLL